MASRKPGIGAKIERAALEIYAERGTLKMTAAGEIAARAGTTERTFFRHFPDKLAAFFGDESRLRAKVDDAIRACPPEMSALAAAITGLAVLAADFEAHSDDIRRRAATVAAHPELQAREMARTAPWTAQIEEALLRRSSPADEAAVTAPIALTIFRCAYEQWIGAPETRAFERLLIDVLAKVQCGIDRAQRELGRCRS
jgi:AcrR family transcriptional regulator